MYYCQIIAKYQARLIGKINSLQCEKCNKHLLIISRLKENIFLFCRLWEKQQSISYLIFQWLCDLWIFIWSFIYLLLFFLFKWHFCSLYSLYIFWLDFKAPTKGDANIWQQRTRYTKIYFDIILLSLISLIVSQPLWWEKLKYFFEYYFSCSHESGNVSCQ